MRLPICANPWIRLLFWVILVGRLCAAEPTGLQFRELKDGKVTERSVPLPPDAVRVFLYEGEPKSVRILEKQIAVDYGSSGVLFDRVTGDVAARFTVAQNWPRVRPAGFPDEKSWRRRQHLVGPGIVEAWRDYEDKADHEKAAVAVFEGQTWEARQPVKPLWTLDKDLSWEKRREKYGTWTGILNTLNDRCQVVRLGPDGKIEQSFTQMDGLPSSIVTHLAASQGALWAACVDIYDYEKKEWGPGGLARYRDGKWEHLKEIDGRKVRWVTLMQAVGDELWIGFLQGDGVAGDKVVYGMGLYPDVYRPEVKTFVLARLKGGEWTSFTRPVLPGAQTPSNATRSTPKPAIPSTERPVQLAHVGNEILLFTRSHLRSSGNWDITMSGHLWTLSLDSGEWKTFSTAKNFDADELKEFIVDQGEVLVTSNVGVHRWDPTSANWKRLDPHCDLRNPCLQAAAAAGDDLWIGYNKPSFGVYGQQGLSRFDETAHRWEHWLPEKIGTACPVQQIVRLPSGELWVLFQQRMWMGSACEYDFYDRERIPRPTGLGCLKDGHWSFPAKTPAEVKMHTRGHKAELVAAGNSLFLSADKGLYRGPGEWKQVAEGTVSGLSLNKDADAILFFWTKDRGQEPLLGRYDLKTEVCSSEKDPTDPKTRNRYGPDAVVGDSGRSGFERLIGSNWARMPKSGNRKDEWVFGPLETEDRTACAVETPKAIWILLWAHAIRIDRRALPE